MTENIFDMSAEVFAEKHPEDVKAWQDKAAEKATTTAQDAERQRFVALQTAFPDHPGFVAKQFISGSTVDEASVAHAEVLKAELVVERAARKDAEDKATALANAVPFVSSDGEPPVGNPPPEGEPKTWMEAITAYRAAHPKADAREVGRACEDKYPELYRKQRSGE